MNDADADVRLVVVMLGMAKLRWKTISLISMRLHEVVVNLHPLVVVIQA